MWISKFKSTVCSDTAGIRDVCVSKQELEELSCKEMQSNQRFKFPSMPEQVLSKGKHINSGSPTADISIKTVLLPMPSHASNNLSLKIIFLMLKRTICTERRRGSFYLLLTENDVSPTGSPPLILAHFPPEIYLHICTLPPL